MTWGDVAEAVGRNVAVLVLAVAGLAACDFGSGTFTPTAGGEAPELDEQAILARLANRAYAEPDSGFVLVSAEAYPSTVAAGHINVWVTEDDWWLFSFASPEVTGYGRSLNVGAVIVREVVDASGEVLDVTVMVRGADGYSPTHGDYWFGLLDPAGAPRIEHDAPVLGPLEQRCARCHDDRAADAFLFGVPVSKRVPSLPVPPELLENAP